MTATKMPEGRLQRDSRARLTSAASSQGELAEVNPLPARRCLQGMLALARGAGFGLVRTSGIRPPGIPWLPD